MPDLTYQLMAVCSDLMKPDWEVPSSRPGKNYHVHISIMGNHTFCDCPAWKFQKGTPAEKRTCKHIEWVKENRCHWTEQGSNLMEMQEGVCPQCGKATEKIMHGV